MPTPEYVRFATHYRFRADFCEALDPQSKDLVENLVGHGKDDLMRPLLLEHALQEGAAIDESFVVSKVLADPPAANARAAAWCAEVNANVHSPRGPRRDHIAGLDAALTHELLRPPKRLESLAT